MEDYRYRLIEIEEEFEDDEEAFESEEFEDDDDDDDDFDDGEREEEDLFRERIVLPVDLDVLNRGERENDDEFEEDDDFDDDDDDDEEEYEEDEELDVARVRDPFGDDEDYDDDEDYEGEDGEYYGEEDEEEEDYEADEVEMESIRVSSSVFGGGGLRGAVVVNNVVVEDSNNSNEACEGKDWDRGNGGGEIHGLFCPICFEAWTSGGEHQICCLPCGHIYGLSCIKKWLQQNRSSGKCPQCNNLCTFKDVRVLYASRLCVADEELHKRVRSLEARCAYLEQKVGRLTPDEMIDQICSNPAAVQRLATVIAGLYQLPVSP